MNEGQQQVRDFVQAAQTVPGRRVPVREDAEFFFLEEPLTQSMSPDRDRSSKSGKNKSTRRFPVAR